MEVFLSGSRLAWSGPSTWVPKWTTLTAERFCVGKRTSRVSDSLKTQPQGSDHDRYPIILRVRPFVRARITGDRARSC